jgi:hypothetical protein
MNTQELALQIAQDFNREVLKGQLNKDGATILELAKRIEKGLNQAASEVGQEGID